MCEWLSALPQRDAKLKGKARNRRRSWLAQFLVSVADLLSSVCKLSILFQIMRWKFSLYVSERLFIRFHKLKIYLNLKEIILKGLKWGNKQTTLTIE